MGERTLLDESHDFEHRRLISTRCRDHLHPDWQAAAATIGRGCCAEDRIPRTWPAAFLLRPHARDGHRAGCQIKEVCRQARRYSQEQPCGGAMTQCRHRRDRAQKGIAATSGNRKPLGKRPQCHEQGIDTG